MAVHLQHRDLAGRLHGRGRANNSCAPARGHGAQRIGLVEPKIPQRHAAGGRQVRNRGVRADVKRRAGNSAPPG